MLNFSYVSLWKNMSETKIIVKNKLKNWIDIKLLKYMDLIDNKWLSI